MIETEDALLDDINTELANLANRVALEPGRRLRLQVEFYELMRAKHGQRGAMLAMTVRTLMQDGQGDVVNQTFNVRGNIGNLNTGTVVGDVTATVNALNESSDESTRALADALRTIVQEVVDSKELQEEQRKEALELLNVVAVEAQKPPEGRTKSVLKVAISGLGTILSTAKTLHDLWTRFGPTVEGFF